MLRIGLIGCGTMGKTHAAAYKNVKQAEVVAVFDLEKEKASVVSEELKAKSVNSFAELLDQDLDILDVCLPTYLHAEYSIVAMKKGIHVFCEKPMAINSEQAKAMLATAEKYHVKLMIGHVLRFFPQYVNAINSIESGKTGHVKLIRTARNQGFPTWSWQNWYQDYEKSGGPVLDLIIHDIDWIIKNFGSVNRVFTQSIKNNLLLEEQDHVQCLLKLNNGMIGYLEGSWALPKGSPFRMAYEIIGTEGQIEYDSTVNSSIKLQSHQEYFNETNSYPFAKEEDPYYLELQSFINAVYYNKEVAVPPEEALEALNVALACVKSSKINKPVILNSKEQV